MLMSISFRVWKIVVLVKSSDSREGVKQPWAPGGNGDPGALDMSLALKTLVSTATPASHVCTLLLCLISTILAPLHLLNTITILTHHLFSSSFKFSNH